VVRQDSVKAVGITGYKKSGKTTLVVSLAQELSKRDYKVATINMHLKALIFLTAIRLNIRNMPSR